MSTVQNPIEEELLSITDQISGLNKELNSLMKKRRLLELKLKWEGLYGENCKSYGKIEYFCHCECSELCSWNGCISRR